MRWPRFLSAITDKRKIDRERQWQRSHFISSPLLCLQCCSLTVSSVSSGVFCHRLLQFCEQSSSSCVVFPEERTDVVVEKRKGWESHISQKCFTPLAQFHWVTPLTHVWVHHYHPSLDIIFLFPYSHIIDVGVKAIFNTTSILLILHTLYTKCARIPDT